MSDSQTPEPRSLSYWLNAETAEPSEQVSEPTVLRNLAYRWSLRRTRMIGLWGSTLFVVTVLVLIPLESFLLTILVVAGGFFAVSALMWTAYYRYRPLPSVKAWEPDVRIRTTRAGVLYAVAFTASMTILILLQLSSGGLERYPWFPTLAVASSMMGAGMSIMQGWHYQHAPQLFRRHIEKNGRVRNALQELALNPPTPAHIPPRFGAL